MSRKKGKSAKRTRRNKSRRKPTPAQRHRDDLAALFDWLLSSDSIFARMAFHGNTKWNPKAFVFAAVLWSWSASRNITDAYAETVDCFRSISSSYIPATYQGFMKSLSKHSAGLMNQLWPVLHERMQEIGGRFWRIKGWLPLAFDGSRSSAPRTVSNEQAFCSPNYGKSRTAKYRKKKSKGLRRSQDKGRKPQPQEPQAWITMMWHMGLRLPWMWRLGPSDSSERGHVMEMVREHKFPKDTLFCGDAGFVGFSLWSCFLEHGHHFLVRVGGNVSLLSKFADVERKKKGQVLCWPKQMQSKQEPLRLRLVKVRIGKTWMFLLTSVLDEKKLTHKQIIKFYEMRWGVEVEFRGLKQTLDRAKLRCRNPQRLYAELHWSIMGMAVAELFALKEQLKEPSNKRGQRPQGIDPAKRSLANIMRALRGSLRKLDEVAEPGKDLRTLLGCAVTDNYERKSSKRARYRPPNPDKKPLGEPTVRKLTAKERKKLSEIEGKTAA